MKERLTLYSPYENENAISLIKQMDGNWKGWMQRHGKVVEVRAGDPNTVLTMLITHE